MPLRYTVYNECVTHPAAALSILYLGPTGCERSYFNPKVRVRVLGRSMAVLGAPLLSLRCVARVLRLCYTLHHVCSPCTLTLTRRVRVKVQPAENRNTEAFYSPLGGQQ